MASVAGAECARGPGRNMSRGQTTERALSPRRGPCHHGESLVTMERALSPRRERGARRASWEGNTSFGCLHGVIKAASEEAVIQKS